MAINLGSGAISKLYLGSTEIQKAYLGGTLVYDAAPAGLLLDDYPAAAAYSLRQLRTGVTNVIRVRESGGNTEADFTPTQITDGTLTAFCGANDGFVVTWYDQSGNGNHFSEATTTFQPAIVLAGVIQVANTPPTLNFIQHRMTAASAIITTNAHSVFTVVKKNELVSLPMVIVAQSTGGAATNRLLVYSERNTGSAIAAHQVDSVFKFATGTPSITTKQRTYIRNSNVLNMYINGTNVLSASDVTTATPINAGMILNSSEPAGGAIACSDQRISELIIYNSDQSANRTAIESNQAAYYGT